MLCKAVLITFASAYVLALLALAVGLFGLLGNERDPLAGVFLIPLGLPWVIWTGNLPDAVRPVAAALAPLVNLGIIGALCRALRRKGHES